METQEKKEVMTVNEFAEATGIHYATVRKLIKEEKVYYFKLGNRYYINYPKTMEHLYASPVSDILCNKPKNKA